MTLETKHTNLIATELNLRESQVQSAMELFEESCTIPFVARYRKERTGSLDEEQLIQIRDRSTQLQELEKRKATILHSIRDQEKLTPELEAQIAQAMSMTELEDIYLPYKPKKRTRALMAWEKGLEPLAKMIMAQNLEDPQRRAAEFINPDKGIDSASDALKGASDIIAEWISENKTARSRIRTLYRRKAVIKATMATGKEEEAVKYENYFDREENLFRTPSHRILAMFRGERESLLKLKIAVPKEDAAAVLERIFIRKNNESAEQVKTAIDDSFKRLLASSIETEMRQEIKENADRKAIDVFADNLRQLLLAPPLGQKRILAIDPGFRTGCKVVCLDSQGKLLHNETIFPHPPKREVKQAAHKIQQLVGSYDIEAIAIGNGTAGRETENFITRIKFDRDLIAVMVNESGASVYSASKLAREEFPEYDVTVRGAVSIGRRLMDPLAELVKIDPKSIGVGQYQHDVDQNALSKSLDDVVSYCVNRVGVQINTASSALLSHVSGIGPALAMNIINYRDENGPFSSRQDLKKVPRFGDKAFQQAAGFLRIRDAENYLDRSAIHPESYHIVEKMAKDLKVSILGLMADDDLRKKIDLNKYTEGETGLPTLKNIMEELDKPGRDPREKFDHFMFDQEIKTIEDVKPGMVLPGIVTNITAFGAFVDLGVHQDGLIHISQMADEFVSDPADHVKLNQKLNVKVVDVDVERKRIQLSLIGVDQ